MDLGRFYWGEDEDVLPGAQTISKLVYNQPMDTIVYT